MEFVLLERNQTMTIIFKGIELIKSLGLTTQEIQRLNNNTYKILALELKKVKNVRSLSFIQGTMVNFLRQVITFTLMWLIFKEILTVGQLISLQFYSFFISFKTLIKSFHVPAIFTRINSVSSFN